MDLVTSLVARETEQLRRSFKPRKVKLLFVGESAPSSGKFFYRESGMTGYTKQAFEAAFERQFNPTTEFLQFFKAQGCYLDDVSLVPVDGMPAHEREQSLVAGVPALARRIRAANPIAVVIVLKKVESHVREALKVAGLDVPAYVLPFPGQGHQLEYIERLAVILRAHLASPM